MRQFAAIAGVLDTTEWQIWRRQGRMVDKHHASFKRTRQATSARDVRREDSAAQAKTGIIGLGNCLILVAHRKEEGYRSEELLTVCKVVRPDLGQNRWLHKRATPIDPLPSSHQPGALRYRLLHLLQQTA